MTKADTLSLLDALQGIFRSLVVLSALVILGGFEFAEKRANRIKRAYAAKGEAVPDSLVPPRNLIPARWRTRVYHASWMGIVGYFAISITMYVLK